MNNLATIQKIEWIKDIPNADKIQLAGVLGWQIVIKKDEYKVGDTCCYIEIDTVVPSTEQFKFLEEKKYKVKTIKLRGELSQGLIIPNTFGTEKIGTDVTKLIGVKKYEKPDNNPVEVKEKKPKKFWKKQYYLFRHNILYKVFPILKRKQRANFPKHLVSITDEPRIQNIPQILNNTKKQEYYLSYKLDGSSCTIIHNKFLFKSHFRICSRRFELFNSNNEWHKAFNSTEFNKHIIKLVKYYKTNNIIVQGECIGIKFNGNHHGLKQDEIRLFNIFVNSKKITPNEFHEVCDKLEIPKCPLHSVITMNHSLEDVLKISQIKDILNPKVEAEGLVWRNKNGDVSFKAINNNYLLKEK